MRIYRTGGRQMGKSAHRIDLSAEKRGKLPMLTFYLVAITVTLVALVLFIQVVGWRLVLGTVLASLVGLTILGSWKLRKEEKLDRKFPIQRLAQALWKAGVETEMAWQLAPKLIGVVEREEGEGNPVHAAEGLFTELVKRAGSPMAVLNLLDLHSCQPTSYLLNRLGDTP